VVVANGHYSEPNLPDVPGSSSWPGLQLHSHNYRIPEAFRDQVVVVVGASNSGGLSLGTCVYVLDYEQVGGPGRSGCGGTVLQHCLWRVLWLVWCCHRQQQLAWAAAAQPQLQGA
jgi:hypothetical protein